MIMVDVQVPGLDTVYDFTLAEDVPVEALIEELVEMVCQRERLMTPRDMGGYALCCVSNGKILPNKATLRDCGVVTGSRLMLV